MINFEDLIKRHEGFSKTLYRCTAGKLTIGYGRNIEDNGISQDEAELMLSNDIEEHDIELTKVFPDPMPDSCYAALLDMHFNLGHTKFMQFRKMIAAVKEGDYVSFFLEESFDKKKNKKTLNAVNINIVDF